MTLEPRYTTRQCADYLGVSTDYIRGEIRERRLDAIIFRGDHRQRASYRVTLSALRDYCTKYCPRVVEQLPHSA